MGFYGQVTVATQQHIRGARMPGFAIACCPTRFPLRVWHNSTNVCS